MTRSKNGRTTYRLNIGNIYLPLLEWLQEVIGLGSIVKIKKYKEHHSQGYSWQCYSWNAKALLEQTIPYMRIKNNKAQQVINELNKIKELTCTSGG